MHEVCICPLESGLEFFLLKDLLNTVLKETHCFAMLLANERNASKVGEFREVFWLFEFSLHELFCTKVIILF